MTVQNTIALETLTVSLKIRVTVESGQAIEGTVISVESDAKYGFSAELSVGKRTRSYELRHYRDGDGHLVESVGCFGGRLTRTLGTVTSIEPLG